MSTRGSGGLALRLAGLFLLGLAGAGCGEGTGQGSIRHVLESGAAPLELLRLSIGAAQRVPFQAIRRYEAHWRADGTEQVLVYREDAFSDGRGGFAIDALHVLEPVMGADEEATFLLLQGARAQFFQSHRDFAIRDERLFLEHWQAIDRGETTVVGRPCVLLDIQRQGRPERTYRVAIDAENGLILRAEERDQSGARIALLEYETLDLAPSPAGRQLFDAGAIARTRLAAGELEAALSFAPKTPKLLPAGYELLESAAVGEQHLGGEWAQFTYSDGVDELFFLHAGKSATGPTRAPGDTASLPGPESQTIVSYLAVGPWTVVYGEVGGDDFVAAGKLAPEALRDLVESAFF
jgi:hypothetical protein